MECLTAFHCKLIFGGAKVQARNERWVMIFVSMGLCCYSALLASHSCTSGSFGIRDQVAFLFNTAYKAYLIFHLSITTLLIFCSITVIRFLLSLVRSHIQLSC
jgi:hypothetical protein